MTLACVSLKESPLSVNIINNKVYLFPVSQNTAFVPLKGHKITKKYIQNQMTVLLI